MNEKTILLVEDNPDDEELTTNDFLRWRALYNIRHDSLFRYAMIAIFLALLGHDLRDRLNSGKAHNLDYSQDLH